MVSVPIELHTRKKSVVTALEIDRSSWRPHWRDIADMYLPRRYVHLLSRQERVAATKNSRILDSTGTIAARTLASGMMNGITSPSRQWFKLRLAGAGEEEPHPVRLWLDEVEKRLSLIMAESNFYNGMATLYLDLVIFGSAAMLIYEDRESVIRTYNSALGEFYFGQSNRMQVNIFARQFTQKAHQVKQRWGQANVSDHIKAMTMQNDGRAQADIEVIHLIEPNNSSDGLVPPLFEFREYYWEKGGQTGHMLSVRGFNELPGIFPRWDLTANEPYGGSPAMDALGDVIQLQHETKAKGQSLDLMNRPPIQADIQLQHKPTALLPRGITYVAGLSGGSGAAMRPVYEVRPPIQELTQDIQQLQARIREIFHNDLFRMIAQLETIRSATEIDARREEKLVLLGPVLERFENEALDPSIKRIFNIADRGGLLPDPPAGFEDTELEVQYVSILSTAQRAVGTAATERFLQVIGETAGVYPKAVNVPDFENLLRNYGRDIGVSASDIRTLEEINATNAAQDQQAQAAADAEVGKQLAEGAQTLSQADVGGGVNALEILTGGRG